MDPCAAGNDCEHICVSSGSSFFCKCHKNYVLNADQRTCSRKRKSLYTMLIALMYEGVPPCKMGHSCQHICVGNGTSYYCKCRPGYVLNEDKRTCSVSRDGGRDGHTDGAGNGRNGDHDDNHGEGSASIDACALGHDCQHTCVSSGSSSSCTCLPGFVLMEDKKSCFKANAAGGGGDNIDDDDDDDDDGSASLGQCGIGHDCEHICVNGEGSYHCKCRRGFVLNEDEKTCS
ncbi:matrilin-3-like isoform X3, partial [Clarias magur]